MIAKVVFDLPLEDPFDYLIPDELLTQVVVGVRVKASFGPRIAVGFVVGLMPEAVVDKVKPIKSVIDKRPIFDQRDLSFAKSFADYYGTSIGEALMVMTRHRQQAPIYRNNESKKVSKLYHCIDGQYAATFSMVCQNYTNYFVLVPDAYVANAFGRNHPIGLRSSMFEAFTQANVIIVIDEDNASFKQEQSPKYDTRQVLFLAQTVYGFDLIFISQTPSVELMYLVETNKVLYERRGVELTTPTLIDTTNYKYLDKGLLSVPVRNALDVNIKAKQKTLILFNRRGTFSVTRCNTCHYVLKCPRCDSAMAYSAAKHTFTCHQCAHHMQDAGNCPTCGVPSWKSFGMGIEKAQKEIANLFPMSRIATFERSTEKLPTEFDVLIATVAIMRYQYELRVATVAVIDIDTSLNRMDMHSSFKAWSLLKHLQSMGQKLLVQTRNLEHPMMKALHSENDTHFYQEELSVRKELKFAPFYHWVALVVRSKKENNALSLAQDVYNHVKLGLGSTTSVTTVMPDTPPKLRDQYRYRLMVGGEKVPEIIAVIKKSLNTAKRVSKVIVTLNIDP